MPKLSIRNIRNTIDTLCSWENKIAGLPEEHEAAEYLIESLENHGLESIHKDIFKVQKWHPKSCQLDILSPIKKSINAAMLPYSQSSEIDAQLVILEQGDNDISTKDKGALGLADWGPHVYLSPYVSYIRVLRREMSGLVLIAPNEGELLKIVVIDSGGLLKVPVISVSKEDGKFLAELIEQGEVHARLVTEVEVGSKADSMNIEAVVSGNNESYEEIVVCAHYDSWFKGAADNSAPAAIVLELARYFHEYVRDGGELKRSIRFLFFGSEESGSTGFYYWDNGSKHYVMQNKDRMKKIAAIFCLDSIGFPSPTPNYIGVTPEILDFAKSIKTKTKKAPTVTYYDPPGYGSDHWFFEISGVPTIYCVAFPSILYHTQKDDPDHLDFHVIEYYTNYLKEAITKLGNLEILPLDIFVPLERFKKIIRQYASIEGVPFDFSPIITLLNDIMKRKGKLQKALTSLSKSKESNRLVQVSKILLNIVNMYNQTINRTQRQNFPDDIDYLAKLEYIADYMDLSNAISSLRNIPLANRNPEAIERLRNQKDNPYNWTNIRQPLTLLEEERSRVYVIIDEELVRLREMLLKVSRKVDEIIENYD